uniref:Uncharacterized protein n=1 Tax=Photinus pyralis TaxID=7054 RepID=A0A1Y1NNP1_PHOPY
MSGARFCVVNIEDEEDSLEVVPTKWLIPSTDACWWPKSGADSNFVKSEVEPCHETWVQVYVEIIQYFRKYSLIRQSIKVLVRVVRERQEKYRPSRRRYSHTRTKAAQTAKKGYNY